MMLSKHIFPHIAPKTIAASMTAIKMPQFFSVQFLMVIIPFYQAISLADTSFIR